MPDTSRRRTHCPAGRPMYRMGEIPAGLATVTMLRDRRRKLAEGQKPVATLFYHGNQHTELYEIAASVEMPPLSPARAARYAAARTCYRCGIQSIYTLEYVWRGPWQGNRRCGNCGRLDARADELAGKLVGRLAATAWARGVLADVTVAIVAECRHQTYATATEVHAELVDGTVLLSAIIDHPRMTGEHSPRARPAGEVENELCNLLLYRRVGLAGGLYDVQLAMQSWQRSQGINDRFPPLLVENADGIGRRWAAWLCQDAWRVHQAQYLPDQPAAAIVAQIRELLHKVADDTDHPDGPAACPALPATGTEPCGSTILPCPQHPPAAADV